MGICKTKEFNPGLMGLNEYQEKAMRTCTPSSDNFSYMFLNLIGEVGEFASKVAKYIRKEKAAVEKNELCLDLPTGFVPLDERDLLVAELGDCLWQLAGLCNVLGYRLGDVAVQNLIKLAARAKAGTIVGEGDGITGASRKV